MEGGTSIGTWIAYGAICLFLTLVSLLTLRVIVLAFMLLISPFKQALIRLRSGGRTSESDRDHD